MGHRALVAYQRPDHLYDVRYSHWGGEDLQLVASLSPDAPLAHGVVDSEVLADSVARSRILSGYLDPCIHEALYLVSPEFEVTAYRVLWLEWGDGREDGRGAIVEVELGDRDLEVRTWFRALKTTLADVVEMGVLSRRAARSYLEARVCEDENGHVYTYGTPNETGDATEEREWPSDGG
ncbi:DUF6735 family protein [Natribaculum luteum]|uniref:DUF6735 family protein n=1 Tax=Natribaculum luteum TaxID=1586232 RepID=A0ABD5NUN4_9EURY|nr:DUF6735 family protein [Natribaculum luteum]